MKRQKAVFWICLLLCGALIAGAFYLIGYKTAYDRMENAVPPVYTSQAVDKPGNFEEREGRSLRKKPGRGCLSFSSDRF